MFKADFWPENAIKLKKKLLFKSLFNIMQNSLYRVKHDTRIRRNENINRVDHLKL